jgi:hypothetical protein
MSETTTRVEWRVESDNLADEFGTDEFGAREWLVEAQCKVRDREPFWEPAVLMCRTVTTTTSDWTAAPPTPKPLPEETL